MSRKKSIFWGHSDIREGPFFSMLNNARPHQSRHRDVRPSQRVKLQVNSLRVLKLEKLPGTKRILHFLDPECREEFGSIRVGQRMWRRRRAGLPTREFRKAMFPRVPPPLGVSIVVAGVVPPTTMLGAVAILITVVLRICWPTIASCRSAFGLVTTSWSFASEIAFAGGRRSGIHWDS